MNGVSPSMDARLHFDQVLLIHPLGYSGEIAKYDISRMANIMPPLGLASIAAYLGKNNIDVTIVDCYAKPNSDEFIKDFLKETRPAFIGFSCSSANFYDGIRIAKMAKNVLPGIMVAFGGHHVSALKEKIVDAFPIIDFAIIGEGEETMAQLMGSNGKGVSSIEGLVYRDSEGMACFTGYRSRINDLDALPFPAYEKLNGYPKAYRLPIFNYPSTPNSSCSSSRGCQYRCSYCDRSVFPDGFRYNSAEYLYEHLLYLKTRFGIRHINFYDDHFTLYKKRVEDFTRLLIDHPIGITFNCAARAEHIDFGLLQQMKAAGCWMISLGIESGDKELLAQHRNNVNLDLVAEKVHLIKKAGIRAKGLMMMGLPGETEQSVKKSMKYIFSLPVDEINISKFVPFPGSQLYENIHDYGTFEEDWEKMDCMHFQFTPKGMSKEELERLFKMFYKKYFLRPKTLLNYVTMLWRSPDSWIRFLCNLPSFVKFAHSDKRLNVPPVHSQNS
jgi:anaerobic magnesium-protoporphyrin IX monomethyl ester cyclase